MVRVPQARAWLLTLILAGLLVAIPVAVQANAMPARSQPGSGGLVVPSATSEVRIERERLTFDFTGSRQAAGVKAVYELANSSARAVTLDLVFIAPGGQALSLALDGVPLTAREVENVELPKEWVAPNVGLDPRTGEEYDLGQSVAGFNRNHTWAFRLNLPAGGWGSLSADYSAVLGYDNEQADYVLRHLVYVLGPAKNWASFGGLEVSAVLPSGYSLTSAPSMAKVSEDGGVARYAATFNGVPSDLLRLSTMRVPSPYVAFVAPIEFGLPVLVALLVAIIAGTLFQRIRRAWLAFFLGGGVAFFATLVLAPVLVMAAVSIEPLASAGEDLTSKSGYGYMLVMLGWMVVVAPFASSLVGGIWAGLGARGRAQRLAPARR